jgi:hypothetical protein
MLNQGLIFRNKDFQYQKHDGYFLRFPNFTLWSCFNISN